MPNDQTPNAAAKNMMWQLKAHMRFNIVGGYAVFNDHGASSYRADDPEIAEVLRQAGRTATRPDAHAIVEARHSARSIGLGSIIVTDQQPHPDVVLAAAEEITGCDVRHVADVDICALGSGSP